MCVDADIIGRIINVSSDGHKFGNIDFTKYHRNDLNEFKQDHTVFNMYADSKLAQIMHSAYLQTKFLANLPIIAVSLGPGRM